MTLQQIQSEIEELDGEIFRIERSHDNLHSDYSALKSYEALKEKRDTLVKMARSIDETI